MNKHELLIIGAGPAGMSAALNAQNDDLDFNPISRNPPPFKGRMNCVIFSYLVYLA